MLDKILSAADDREIRDAIKLVSNSFMVTPITYCVGIDVVDRFGEDNDSKIFYAIDFGVLKESDPSSVDNVEVDSKGSVDGVKYVLTANKEDLYDLGLLYDDYTLKINPTNDFVIIYGEVYSIRNMQNDGPLSEKDLLLVMKVKRSPNSNLPKNIIRITHGSEIDYGT